MAAVERDDRPRNRPLSNDMIEIEKKVRLTEKHLLEISKKGKLLGEKTFTDIYYDTPEYKLTTQNIWLRERDAQFELKGAVKVNRRVDSYEEIVDDREILDRLQIDCNKTLHVCLKQSHIIHFCTFRTFRRQFLFDGIHVDLDRADFGDIPDSVINLDFLLPPFSV